MKVVIEMYDGTKYTFNLPEWVADLPREKWKQAVHDLFPHVEGVVKEFREIPANVMRKFKIKSILRKIWEYSPYILATLAGFLFRSVLMCCKGYDYSINGYDILNAAICFMGVYFVKKLIKNGEIN